MEKKLIIIKIEKRNEEATTVQKILTEHGCIIKTRLGLHETGPDSCSPEGLIILELTADAGSASEELFAKLSKLHSVKAKEVSI